MRNRFDDDVIDGILRNSREITERREQESELRDLSGEYESRLNDAEDAVFFVDLGASDDDITSSSTVSVCHTSDKPGSRS
jgi:PAS domain-containing protein